MVAQWRAASAKNYSIAFGIFCARECAGSTALDRQEEAFKKALGPQQTTWIAEANLASGKRVEKSVPYGSQFDFICWVLEDTGLDREFARLKRLCARHSSQSQRPVRHLTYNRARGLRSWRNRGSSRSMRERYDAGNSY